MFEQSQEETVPFCPNCEYEYKAGVSTCPDCEEPLVDKLPEEEEESETEYDDWVHMARLNSDQYARMLLEALHAKDIPAVIRSGTGHFGQTGQMGTSSFRPVGGGYSLFVPQEFLQQADTEAELLLGEEWHAARLIDFE
ncbi:MAG: hypothetical protein JSU65_00200 [Candidatus Zixiibacteriota bacterium]|nr:MAG: hypothetical protein JSU65_00200 [candidate division Zixibacteria bacterium]